MDLPVIKRKLTDVQKQEVIKKSQTDANSIINSIQFIKDWGAYKTRQAHRLSDVNYLASIDNIKEGVFKVFHCHNIAMALIKRYELLDQFNDTVKEFNDIMIAERDKKIEGVQ